MQVGLNPGVLIGISVMLVLLATLIAVRAAARSTAGEAPPEDAWFTPESEEEKASKYLYRPEQRTMQEEETARALRVGEPRRRGKRVDLSGLPDPGAGGAVFLALAPARLNVGRINATLGWELRIKNAGTSHLVSARVASDVILAGSANPSPEMFQRPAMAHVQTHRIARLDPGAETVIRGQWQIPLADADGIEQESRRLAFMIARIRIVAAGIPPVRRALVIGTPPDDEGAHVLHVGLDDGPKVIESLTARMVDPR